MIKFRKFYFDLNKTFNPDRFDPKLWAEYAWNAGMRYMVMTTKHHDGFSMFNTRLDSYSVVGRDCPFKRDAFGEVAKAFRERNFAVGAYFSKPDWHREDFWEPKTFARTKYSNYVPKNSIGRWESFVRFTQGQIKEIMTQYKPDILWFDGGWLRPPMYDFDFAQIAESSRRIKDNVIIVNRAGGIYEDYLTPEQGGVPRAPFVKPWEVCVTMATQWGYKKDDTYKSMPQLIELLLSVVSTGGNLLLDVGPDPHGQLPRDAIDRLKHFASWMKYNGEGIHDSEPVYPYKFLSTMNEQVAYSFYLTRRGRDVYVYMIWDQRNTGKIPRQVHMAFVTPSRLGDMKYRLKTVKLLSVEKSLNFHFESEMLVVEIPQDVHVSYDYTLTFKLSEH